MILQERQIQGALLVTNYRFPSAWELQWFNRKPCDSCLADMPSKASIALKVDGPLTRGSYDSMPLFWHIQRPSILFPSNWKRYPLLSYCAKSPRLGKKGRGNEASCVATHPFASCPKAYIHLGTYSIILKRHGSRHRKQRHQDVTCCEGYSGSRVIYIELHSSQ